MITLSKENVVDYVKSRLNFFNLNGDIKVSAIGEGSVEEDGDGFINFVYRVSDGEHHLIVKQSILEARSKGSFTLPIFPTQSTQTASRKAVPCPPMSSTPARPM